MTQGRLSAFFKFGSCFSRRSSRRSETKARPGSGSGATKSRITSVESHPRKSALKATDHDYHKSAPKPALVKPAAVRQYACASRNSSSRAAHSRRNVLGASRELSNSTTLTGELSKSTTIRNSSSRAAHSRRNVLGASGELLNSTTLSGELSKSATISRSSSRSLSKLRDQYVRVMLKMADMSNQTGSAAAMGVSVQFESQVFESEVLRKRSQVDEEVMDYYLQSSIQPNEWKDAQLGNRLVSDNR